MMSEDVHFRVISSNSSGPIPLNMGLLSNKGAHCLVVLKEQHKDNHHFPGLLKKRQPLIEAAGHMGAVQHS